MHILATILHSLRSVHPDAIFACSARLIVIMDESVYICACSYCLLGLDMVCQDMVVIGKGLGGGVLPLSALIASEELNEVGECNAPCLHQHVCGLHVGVGVRY